MKILSAGIFLLAAWIAFSSYIYVCKIKGLCQEPVPAEISAVTPEDALPADSLVAPSAEEEAVIPKDLVIYFAFDRSEFKPDTQTDNYILESRAYLDKNPEAKLSLTGHTCSVGTDEYNQALGLRRAKSVKQYFESRGMPASNIIIESRGEKEPSEDNSTSAGRAKNRRTEITLTT